MNNQPFFTIGIPVYNSEKYVTETIHSILNQSFTDFEIVVVNDGSTDNSPNIVSQFVSIDNKLRLINKNNSGPSACRNTVLYTAKGKYVFFIDSDDLMCEKALQNAYDVIIKNDFPDILHAGFIRVIQGEETLCPNKYSESIFSSDSLNKDERWIEFVSYGDVGNLCSKFFRTDFLRREGLTFSERLWAQEDYDFICKTFRHADTMCSGDFFTFKYLKQHENSLSTEWSYKAVLGVLTRWTDYFHDTKLMNISDKYIRMLEDEKTYFLSEVRKGSISMPFHKTKEDAFKFVLLLEELGLDREIKKLPVSSGLIGVVCFLYKILGIRNTQKLLFLYVKLFK